jgi:hypothetical protein
MLTERHRGLFDLAVTLESGLISRLRGVRFLP